MKLAVALLAMVTVAAGCAQTYALHAGELPPSAANVPPENRLAVWQHAVVVLLDQGYVPQVLNETAGYINAHRRDDLANDALAGTIALVTIATDGGVHVLISGVGTFHSEDEFKKAMADRQQQLLQLIIGDVHVVPAPPG